MIDKLRGNICNLYLKNPTFTAFKFFSETIGEIQTPNNVEKYYY